MRKQSVRGCTARTCLTLPSLAAVLLLAVPPLRFDDVRFVPTLGSPELVRVGDFDEDGWPDLVHIGRQRNPPVAPFLVLHLNDRAGGFLEPILFEFELNATNLEVADVDADGHLDLVVSVSDEPPDFRILFGDGSGGFASQTVETPYRFDVRTIADLNGDGHLDLVGVMELRIAVYLGDGAGGFPTLRVSTADFPPDKIALVDLDEDGRLDVAFTGNFDAWLGVMTGLGDGRFGEFRLVGTGSRPVDVSTAEFTGDGHEDIAVAVAGAPSVVVLPGDGAGGFATSISVPGAPTDLDALLVSDWERDGHPDIAVVSQDRSVLHLWRGDGAGAFETALDLPLAWGPVELAVADVDRDGDRDTIVTLSTRKRLIVLPGRGSHGMADPPPTALINGVYQGDCTAADFDEDGHVDVAIGSGTGVDLLPGDGRGHFGYRYRVAEPSRIVRYLKAADMNGDGHADLVTAGYYSSDAADVRVWAGDGQGGFVYLNSNPAGRVIELEIADFDNDGAPDVADLAQGFVRIRLNDGSGTLAPPIVVVLTDLGRDFTVGDFNGDGFLDLAASLVTASYTARIKLFFGDGTGNFPTSSVVESDQAFAAWVRTFDLDADGDLDLLCSGAGGPPSDYYVYVFLGDGAGGFTFRGRDGVGTRSFGPSVAGDFDEDGHVDLAHASYYGAYEGAAVVRGDGAGGFLDPTAVLLAVPYARLLAGDFDEDGHLDLVIPSRDTNRVTFHRNRTFEALECRQGEVNAGAGPRADVLLVDGSTGEGPQRRLVLALGQPFEVRMELPPGVGSQARFALYAWDRAPYVGSVEVEPYRLGRACLPTPLGPSFLAPRVIWNNSGDPRLGTPTRPSSPAPTVVGAMPAGHGLVGSFFLQGIIEDPLSPSGKAAVTNGIEVVFQ